MTKCIIKMPAKKYELTSETVSSSFLLAVIKYMWDNHGKKEGFTCSACVWLRRRRPETVCVCGKYPYRSGNTWRGHWTACGLLKPKPEMAIIAKTPEANYAD